MSTDSTRTASLLLVFGFFFFSSCSTQKHSLDEASSQFDSGNYEMALESVSNSLEESPGDPDLVLLKGEVLSKLALERDIPGERLPYYREMRRSLNGLDSRNLGNGERERFIEYRDSLLSSSWETEHIAASELFLSNVDDTGLEREQILDHFENALELVPDSSDTYAVKTAFHYQTGELARALQTLDRASEQLQVLTPEMREKKAFLLLEEGEFQQALGLYVDLAEEFPDNEQIRHGLVNAYILNEQHEHSVRILRQLSEQHPNNISYHQSLATELFFLAQDLAEQASREGGEQPREDFYSTLQDHLEEAEEHYRIVMENHPYSEEVTYNTAAFYKNAANQLIHLAENGTTSHSDELEAMAHELLDRSIPVWQQLTETNPESGEVWRSIYQIYSRLGMEDEAAEAEVRIH